MATNENEILTIAEDITLSETDSVSITVQNVNNVPGSLDTVEKSLNEQQPSKNETKRHGKKDENEEDVPADFFDDLLNQDFIAGLDIVDDDEWENENGKKVSLEEGEIHPEDGSKDSSRKRRKKDGNSENARRSPVTRKPAKSAEKPSYSTGRKRDTKEHDDFDNRRDPEKTKRDIQRDKAKCAKDKEKKLLTSVVETGLVPPGMEMEVSLEELKTNKKTRSRSRPRERRSTERKRKTRSKSLPKRKISPKRINSVSKKRSPLRKTSPLKRSPLRKSSPLSPSLKHPVRSTRKFSPVRKPSPWQPSSPPVRRVSPLRRSPNFRISPYRRSPIVRLSPRRARSPRQRSPIRLSPSYYRRTDRYSPRRERSYSPKRRRRSRSRTPRRRKADDKKSFLQELAEKLNETSSRSQMPQNYVSYPLPQPVPAPVPVPAPHSAPFYPQTFDQYDQQFFIGAQGSFMSQPQMNVAQSPVVQQIPLNLPVPGVRSNTLASPISVQNLGVKKQTIQEIPSVQTKDELAKLLEEKKISLSDFLSVTAKSEVQSSQPAQLREKIKVISRCQDALRFLANDKLVTGKLKVIKETTPSEEKPLATPLSTSSNIAIPFSSVQTEQESYPLLLNRLFKTIGVPKTFPLESRTATIVIEDDDGDNPEAPPAPLISESPSSVKIVKSATGPKSTSMFGTKFLMKMVQTEPLHCERCVIRNKKKYSQIGVQCGSGQTMMVSVGTQVTDEDITPKKKQSLAALTPAQLLGMRGADEASGVNPANSKVRMIDPEDFDIRRSGGGGYDHPSFARADGFNMDEPKQPLPSLFNTFNPTSQTSPFGRTRDLGFRPTRGRYGGFNNRY